MPDLEITGLPELAEGSVQATDAAVVADISANETKKLTVKALIAGGVAVIDDGDIPAVKVGTLTTNQVPTIAIQNLAITNDKIETSSSATTGIDGGTKLRDGTVTVDKFDASKFDRGLSVVSSKLGITNVVASGAGTKNGITYSVEGLIVSVADLTASDLSQAGATTTALGAVSVPTAGALAIDSNSEISLADVSGLSSGTYVSVTVNAKGQVTSGTTTVPSSAISTATTTVKGGVIVPSDSGMDVDGSGNISIETQSGLTAGDYTKVSVSTRGIITAATNISGSDIPAHSAALLTSGEIPADRIGNNAITTDRILNSAVNDSKISGVSGTKVATGSLLPAAINPSNLDRSINVSGSGNLGINNAPVGGAGTKNGITYNSEGLISSVADLSNSDLSNAKATTSALGVVQVGSGLSVTSGGVLSISSNAIGSSELGDSSVDTNAIIDSAVNNSKISDVSGTKITTNTIPATALNSSNIDRSLNVSGSGNLGINNTVSAVSGALKVNYNAQGLITGSSAISSSDLTGIKATSSAIGVVSVPASGGLSVSGTGELSIAATTTAATVRGIEYNSFGQIVSISALQSSDLVTATNSDKGAVIIQTGGGLEVDNTGNLSTAASGVSSGTYQSVVVNNKGVITSGSGLTAAQIPDLSATQITSGTLDGGRFAASSIAGDKLQAQAICRFSGATSTTGVVQFPSNGGDSTGQFFFDLSNDDLYVFDGNAWQPCSITSGEIIFSGLYDCSSNTISSLSSAGTAQGFTVGAALVAASAANNRYYFVCDKSGTGTSPAPTVTINPPDMIISNGNSWEKLDISSFIAGQSANNISVTPNTGSGGGINNTNVQSVLEELDSEKLNKAGGVLTGSITLNENSTLIFEGATPDNFESVLNVVDPTADRTLLLPDISGTLITNQDSGTVSSGMILNGTIVSGDISATAGIQLTQIENVSSAHIIVGSASNIPTAVNMTGNIGINSSGLTTIQAGVIVDSMISGSTTIASSKVQSGSTTVAGVLQLSSSVSSASTSLAATASAIKTVNDALTTTTSVANAAVEKAGDTMSGNLILGNAKQVRFSELTSSGANYISLQAPDALAADTSYTLPSALPTAEGQILASTTGGVLSWVSDPAGQWVTSGDNISYSAGDVSFIGASANLKWDKSTDDLIFDDGVKALFGTSSDGLAIYHNGSNSVIGDIGTGNLVLQTNGTGIYFQASGENLATFTKDGACALFFDNDRKIRTTGTGAVVESTTGHTYFQVLAEEDVNTANAIIRITPTNTSAAGSIQFGAVGATSAGKILYSNNTNQFEFNTNNLLALTLDSSQKAIFAGDTSLGDSGTAYFGSDNDLWMMHNGSTGYINNSTGDLYIRDTDGDIYIQAKAGENSIVAHNDAACELYYDGGTTPTFETKATGAVINGTLNTGGLSVGSGTSSSSHMHIGASATGDNYAYIDLVGDTTYTDYGARLIRGSGGANTTTSLVHRGTGQLQITAADAGSISLNTSNTAALTIASNHDATFTGDVDLADNKKIKLGTSDDLQIYHNSLRNLIECHNSRELHINKDTSESLAKFIPDGAVQLFYDNNKKFQTLSNGCQVSNSIGDVYFEVKASENVNTADSIIRAAVANTSAHSIIQFGDSDNWSKSSIDYDHASDEMHFKIDATERFKVNASGIQVSGGALGQNSGDELLISRFKNTNNHQNYLDVKQIRDSAGTSWTSSATRIQQSTDSTDQGYIEFNGTNNNTGVIVGTGSGSQDDISIKCVRNNRVELHYNGVPKLQTTSWGAETRTDGFVTFNIHSTDNDAVLKLTAGNNEDTDWTIRNDLSATNILDFRYNNGSRFQLNTSGDLWIQGNLDISDNDKLLLGNGDDMQIYHDITSNRNRIDNFGRDFYLINKNTDGSVYEEQLKAEPNGRVVLYWDGAPKFNTTSIGANLEGNLTLSAEINLLGGSDAPRFIDAQLGDNNELHFRRVSGGDLAHENMAKFTGGGACKLYYDASTNPKFETTSQGIKLTDGGPVLTVDATNNSSGLRINVEAQTTGELLRVQNDGTTKFQINHDGNVLIGRSSSGNTGNGHTLRGGDSCIFSRDATGETVQISRNSSDGEWIQFRSGDSGNASSIGTISKSGSSVAYNTSSDYRLKENEVAISDGITRLKTLKPYRFNFKTEPSKTVDGFFAHEVTPSVPEAITGEKDGAEMQGIDQSKLVPLLTAALQEAITKIETLETKVAALESS